MTGNGSTNVQRWRGILKQRDVKEIQKDPFQETASENYANLISKKSVKWGRTFHIIDHTPLAGKRITCLRCQHGFCRANQTFCNDCLQQAPGRRICNRCHQDFCNGGRFICNRCIYRELKGCLTKKRQHISDKAKVRPHLRQNSPQFKPGVTFILEPNVPIDAWTKGKVSIVCGRCRRGFCNENAIFCDDCELKCDQKNFQRSNTFYIPSKHDRSFKLVKERRIICDRCRYAFCIKNSVICEKCHNELNNKQPLRN